MGIFFAGKELIGIAMGIERNGAAFYDQLARASMGVEPRIMSSSRAGGRPGKKIMSSRAKAKGPRKTTKYSGSNAEGINRKRRESRLDAKGPLRGTMCVPPEAKGTKKGAMCGNPDPTTETQRRIVHTGPTAEGGDPKRKYSRLDAKGPLQGNLNIRLGPKGRRKGSMDGSSNVENAVSRVVYRGLDAKGVRKAVMYSRPESKGEEKRATYGRLTAKEAKVRAIYADLADREREHLKTFQSMLGPAGDYANLDPYTDEYALYLKNLVDTAVFKNEESARQAAQEAGSESEAIDIGIQAEKDSILFYSAMQGLIRRTDARIVGAIINEERSHLAQLSELKSGLGKPRRPRQTRRGKE